MALFRSKEEAHDTPIMKVNLRGCEVHPDVNIAQEKYGIKLFVPSSDGMSEVWIRCDGVSINCQGKIIQDSRAKGSLLTKGIYFQSRPKKVTF